MNRIVAVALAVMMTLIAVPAFAQAPGGAFTPDMLAALEKEKELTQADIDGYIKTMPEIGKAMGTLSPADQQNPEAVKNAMEGVAKASGLTEIRFAYISAKVGYGMMLASGVDAKAMGMDNVPKAITPTEAEVALVKKNLDKLQQASMSMMTSMQPK